MRRSFPWLIFAIFCIYATPLFSINSPHILPYETSIKKLLVPIAHIEPTSGMPGISCMYVINLEKRAHKWQRIQRICKQMGLFPTRIPAVEGTKLSKKKIKKLFGKYPIHMSRGAIGCLLSHVSAFVDAHQRNFDRVWICEDDIDFLDDPGQIPFLLAKLTRIDPDWDIFYTDPEFAIPACYYNYTPGSTMPNYSTDIRPNQVIPPKEHFFRKDYIDEDFTAIGQRFGAYSYIVSKKGIAKLVHYFLHVHLWSAIDMDMHYVPYIRQYVVNRNIVSHWVGSGTRDTTAH